MLSQTLVFIQRLTEFFHNVVQFFIRAYSKVSVVLGYFDIGTKVETLNWAPPSNQDDPSSQKVFPCQPSIFFLVHDTFVRSRLFLLFNKIRLKVVSNNDLQFSRVNFSQTKHQYTISLVYNILKYLSLAE